ncbi:MAG TPA: hypothetical protein VLL05_15930 [Terriglobales bacterium]|nr:hypothetical protein [Terriglobales bacterium]
MIITAFIIASAVLALIFFVLRGFGATHTPPDVSELTRQIKPVDLEAFRNLTEPYEEEFLRSSLSSAQFRAIQRERLRASIDYLGGVSHNAGILLQLGQVARRSPDERIAEVGRRLTDDALRTRLYCMTAICKLGIRYVFPDAALQPGTVIERYQRVTEEAVRLGRLQYPERGGLLSRAL